METIDWEKEREKIREAALERHARLHRLFHEDRLAFERERKRMINSFLQSIEDPARKERLEEIQEAWDKRMRHAGSQYNRFVLAQTFFWDHFYRNWQPALQDLSTLCNKLGEGNGDCNRSK
ncbi:MAG: DUF3135 domain-containing protein [Deltaproteobacteria bacterium]|nr:DUF3135 domain-containing protein [Deltaproteobacteria bacterium]MBW2017427.1 DUF3135 domain-containing protein [Deltaproteobacteria bacterium]MBW2129579.1 DUF3135 domain-containing protein [Deltaproteobacteria bacterium]MBW2303429.1 DUF3135 domain-containing protein [Deltaproteobacteria bacterium]